MLAEALTVPNYCRHLSEFITKISKLRLFRVSAKTYSGYMLYASFYCIKGGRVATEIEASEITYGGSD